MKKRVNRKGKIKLESALQPAVDCIYGSFMEFLKSTRDDLEQYFVESTDPFRSVAMWHRAAEVYGRVAQMQTSREQRNNLFVALMHTAIAATDLMVEIGAKTQLSDEAAEVVVGLFFGVEERGDEVAEAH